MKRPGSCDAGPHDDQYAQPTTQPGAAYTGTADTGAALDRTDTGPAAIAAASAAAAESDRIDQGVRDDAVPG